LSGLPQVQEVDSPTGLYVEFLTAEIDFRNLRNALRLARSGAEIDPAEYFIDGGKLFDRTSVEGLVANREQLGRDGPREPLRRRIDDALDDLEQADDLIQFEHALDAALLEYADKLTNRYPLSICPVLSYVLAKEREVDNIRAIARGREAGLGPDEIERELVIL